MDKRHNISIYLNRIHLQTQQIETDGAQPVHLRGEPQLGVAADIAACDPKGVEVNLVMMHVKGIACGPQAAETQKGKTEEQTLSHGRKLQKIAGMSPCMNGYFLQSEKPPRESKLSGLHVQAQ